MDRLKGKVALISGGARGQGAAEARLFAAEGAKVVIGDVLDDQAAKTAQEINAKAGGRAVAAVHLDVTRAADWRAAVDASANSAAWTSWSTTPASSIPRGWRTPPRSCGTRSLISIKRAYGWG